MGILEAVEKLEGYNKEQQQNLEQLHDQFEDLRADPRFANLPMNELEDLFLSYLKIWIKTNNEIIDILTNRKSNSKD